MYQSEYDMYGSSRLGTINTNTLVYPRPVNQAPGNLPLGLKWYELSNHLGNINGCCAEERSLTAMNPERSNSVVSGVLSTISDLKTPLDLEANTITEGFAAVVVNQHNSQ